SDHFTSDDSSRESSSDSSSESSSEFHSDTSPYSSLRHSSSASSVPRALSPVCFDLLPPHKRIKDFDFVINFDVSSEEGYVPYVPKQIGLAVDVEDSYEPYTEPNFDHDVKEYIDAYIAFTNDIAARGTLEEGYVPYVPKQIGLAVDVEDSYEPYTEPNFNHDVKEDIDACIAFTGDIAARWTEDYLDLVCADGSLEVMQRGLDMVMQELYDQMVKIQVHRVRVIESVQKGPR
nr:hypothetical protein [Tanacetum cinerariifolium]